MNYQGRRNAVNRKNDYVIQPNNFSIEDNPCLPGPRFSNSQKLYKQEIPPKKLLQLSSQFKSPEFKLKRNSTGLALASSQIPRELYTQYVEQPTGDIQELVFYQDIMYQTLSKNQLQNWPTKYIQKQNDFNIKHREALVDWMFNIKSNYVDMYDETFFLAVNYLDRYLAEVKVKRKDLNKIAMTVLYIASKYEDVIHISISTCQELLVNTGLSEIKKLEKHICNELKFKLVIASSLKFLHILITKFKIQREDVYRLAKFLCHIPLLNYNMITFEPNRTAAAALHFSLQIYEHFGYTQELEQFTGFNYSNMKDILKMFVVEIANIFQSNYLKIYFKSHFLQNFGNNKEVKNKINEIQKKLRP